MVIEEVPVDPVGEADVRLQDEEAAARSQNPEDLAERDEDIVLAHEVLEDVAREDDVDARRPAPGEVVGGSAMHLHARIGEAAHALVGLDRPALAAADVVHELAEARAEIEQNPVLRHPALEEVLAEDLPERLLRSPVPRPEADVV